MISSPDDWRASLSASDRYDNISAMCVQFKAFDQGVIPDPDDQKSAFQLENEAYEGSQSRSEYDAQCLILPADEPQISQDVEQGPGQESPGITIGLFRQCHYVARGVTAEVYRSGAVALKVITETHNMEPHNPHREAKILRLLARPCIPLLETFRDQEQRFTLLFPYMPLSLESLLELGAISRKRIVSHFRDLCQALADIHDQGIIHRDVKPSALLLASADGPAYLSDFGTAWHPEFSTYTEPPDQKILDIGTGPYRAPETLFGDKAYGPPVDMWAAGTMLAECCRPKPQALFQSPPTHEDGNQLGLILSMFKTIGSPTRETWPEAEGFKTPPFDMYQVFEEHTWEEVLPDIPTDFRDLVAGLVRYQSSRRLTASQALNHPAIQDRAEDSEQM
ncbi:protein kinase-like protein [Xylariomycetidae sp. FL2044]|nr:protein kinase-like protein [Xylariomycetidae sp. FL2044]